MNRIYSLRYSAVARGFIAVSEFARKCVHKSVRRLCFPVLLLIPVLFSAGSLAGTVNNELGYQLFRDFDENKGMFRPGATNIAIYNKQGEFVGTLDKAAMPDFSAVDSEIGVATLINPQYIASVKHNGGYTNVSFGDGENRYNIVDRNNAPSLDFHAPRLDKLVTEVAPTAVTAQGAVAGAYLDKERYPVFYRLGSGTQYIKDSNGQLTKMGGAYSWLTGGTVGSLSSYQNGEMISTSSGLVFDYKLNGAMPIYGEAGDSGSPLFAFDTVQNKWVLVGVLTAGNGAGGRGNNWAVIPLDFIGQKFNEDNDAPVTFRTSEGGALEWSFNSSTGAGALTQGTTTYAMHGQQGNDLNAGKNLIFQGQNGQINLKDSVSQGAGSLTFRDNYTVTTSNGSTWTGAGIVVDNGVSVNWQVNGVKGDNLHKIGEGTLTVQGTGINEGGLKVGDGKVVLNQQADNKGQVQAFSSVNIASGRPTVVLTDERQVNPDTVSWGYRGGTLDVNGNSLTFHQLKAADYGAVLANNVDKRATITLDYALRADKVALNGWSESGKGTAGNLYKYNNPYTNTTDYFILKQSTYGYFPTDQSSNATWEFVGHSQGDAQKLVADRFNTAGYLFHGQLKGNLNVDNRLPEGVTSALVMDGAADISGTFTQENGRLTLQGHPVIHAYNTQSVADKLAASGDHSVLTQPTSFSQEDWENRSFTFDRLSLKNTDFGLGRNATLNTTIQADNSSVTLGDSRVFIDKNDGQGTAFTLEEGTSVATKDADKSVFNGTVNLDNQSVLNIN
ncbi:hemoglobin-binding protease autotransporter Hbp, partial [Escherichia coli]